MLCPALGSQSFTGCWVSLLPEANRFFLGCQSTLMTSAPCPENNVVICKEVRYIILRTRLILFSRPLRMNSSAQRTKSNVLTVPSSEHVASFVSVGEKLCRSEWRQVGEDKGEMATNPQALAYIVWITQNSKNIRYKHYCFNLYRYSYNITDYII